MQKEKNHEKNSAQILGGVMRKQITDEKLVSREYDKYLSIGVIRKLLLAIATWFHEKIAD